MHPAQDWRPTIAAASEPIDSQGDSLGEVQPKELGQQFDGPGDAMGYEFELNQIIEDLESQLPDVPLPGPSHPQVASPLRSPPATDAEIQKEEEPVARPVATPCRSDRNDPPIMETNEASHAAFIRTCAHDRI